MSAFLLSEAGQYVRWITVNFGKTSVYVPGVEVRRVDIVGPQFAGIDKAQVQHALSRSSEIINQATHMMEAFFALLVHIPIDRWRIIMLLDKLNVGIAEIPEGIRDIRFLWCAAILKFVGLVMWYEDEGTGTVESVPLPGSLFNVIDEVGVLKNRINHASASLTDSFQPVAHFLHK